MPPGRWRWTGRTWILLPATAARHRRLADPEASWGHRKNNLLRSEDELFYGYYLSAGVMMPDENGPRRPRTRPPCRAIIVPARPGPRLRPRADRDARTRDPARRHP